MMRMTEKIRTRGFRRALTAGAFGAIAFGAAAIVTPALADTYYVESPPPVYVPAPSTTTTTTYTYSSPTYTYVEPAPTYVEPAPPPTVVYEHHDRGPGVYLDTPVINLGIGFH